MNDLDKYYAKLDGAELELEQSKIKAIEYIHDEVDGFIFDLKRQIRNDHPTLHYREINELVKEIVKEYIWVK